MRNALYAGLAALVGTAHGQTVAYDTFNEVDPTNLFDCCNSLLVSGASSPPGRNAVAIPVYNEGPTQLVEIDVALSDENGEQSGDRYRVEVTAGDDDLPGGPIHKFTLKSPPAGGQCCRFVSEEVKGVHLRQRNGEGLVYWIAIIPVGPNVFGGWNLNTVGTQGHYAVQVGPSDWLPMDGTLPAIRVFTQIR